MRIAIGSKSLSQYFPRSLRFTAVTPPKTHNSFLRRHLSAATQPTLDIEYPGIPKLTPASSHIKPTTKLTTLANGLRVASEDTYGQVATIGLFVDAGSKYETYDNNGVSHLIEHLAFKSTEERSSLRIVRDMEEIGASVGAASARECIMFTGECLRKDDAIASVVQTMAETVLRPKLAPWDIDAQKTVIGYELQSLESNAQSLLTEVLHAAAFGENSALGRSLWCPQRNLSSGKLDAVAVRQFLSRWFKKNRMVLSGANIEHDRLVSLAEKYFMEAGNYESSIVGSEDQVEVSVYLGGSKFVESDSEFTHITLAFNPGTWKSENLIDVCTLHFLLGGGGSFSAGGPGKGMYSRLYQNVLNEHHWVDSAVAFNSLYNEAGLFGIYGSCLPQNAGDLTQLLSDEMLKLKNEKLSDEEVSRAKNQLKSSMLMKLESRQVLFEDIGRQILTYGKRETAEELCKKVDAVNAASLKKTATEMMKSKLTLAAFGNVGKVPKYENLAKKFL